MSVRIVCIFDRLEEHRGLRRMEGESLMLDLIRIVCLGLE